jgi:hypothetical protein
VVSLRRGITLVVLEVDAGSCGFITKIEVLKVDARMVKVVVSSAPLNTSVMFSAPFQWLFSTPKRWSIWN